MSANQVSEADSLAYATAILSQAKNLGPVLMVESPPIADDLAANQRLVHLNQQIEDLCNTIDIPYIQTYRALEVNP